MTLKSSRHISICSSELISYLITICYIRYRCVFLRSTKKLMYVEDLPIFTESSSLYHYNAICLPILDWPLVSCENQQKPVDAYFFQGGIEDPVYDRLFQIILCYRLVQTNNMIIQEFILQTLSSLNNTLNK